MSQSMKLHHARMVTYDRAIEICRETGGKLPFKVKQFWPAGLADKLRKYCYDENIDMIWLMHRCWYLPKHGEFGSYNKGCVDFETKELDLVYVVYEDTQPELEL